MQIERLSVDEELLPGMFVLITKKHPRAGQWNSNDYQVYKSLVAHTKVKSFPNRAGASQPHATWKWKRMLKKMEAYAQENGYTWGKDSRSRI